MAHGMIVALITVVGIALGGFVWVILLARPGREERRVARLLRASDRRGAAAPPIVQPRGVRIIERRKVGAGSAR